MMKSLLAFLCLFLLFIYNVQGQRITLSRDQALADIDTLVSRIIYTHPDPFTVCPESVFRERIALVKAELPDSLTSWEFALKIVPCVVALGDGHTFASLPFQKLSPEMLLFPGQVQIDWRDSTLTLRGDSVKVIRINDMPVQNVLGEMVQYVGGERMFYRFFRVQQMFQFFLPQLYPDSIYRLVLLDSVGKQTERTVKILTYAQVVKKMQAKAGGQAKKGKDPDYAFLLSKDGKSMLFSFNSFNDPDKFKSFADSMFRELQERKIKNLVIDIRKNGGGNSKIGDELLQYISHTPFAQFGEVQMRVGRYNKYLFGGQAKEIEDTLVTSVVPLIPLRDEPLRVRKKMKIYLLTSHNTFSSAADFSWAFQYFGVGTVVGEESGGMNVCFGDILPFRLPHSGLQCGVSWKKFRNYGADDQNIHGTLPDVEVPAEQAFEYTVKHLIRKGH